MKAITPTPERLNHAAIRRSNTVADSNGSIGHPWHCQSLLDNLLAKSDITSPEHTAGCHFHELMVRAAVPNLRAADMRRTGHRNAGSITLGSEPAKRQLGLALDALGGLATPMGSLAWDVLGCDHSLSEWSRRQRWTGGRQTAAAKGVLLSLLPILALHFGLTRPIITR